MKKQDLSHYDRVLFETDTLLHSNSGLTDRLNTVAINDGREDLTRKSEK